MDSIENIRAMDSEQNPSKGKKTTTGRKQRTTQVTKATTNHHIRTDSVITGGSVDTATAKAPERPPNFKSVAGFQDHLNTNGSGLNSVLA